MRRRLMILATVMTALVLAGCGTDDSRDTADANAQDSDKPVPAKPDAPTSTPTGSAKTTAGSKLKIGSLLPRPIQSEKDAEECLARAADLDRQSKEITGLKPTNVTKRCKDYVVKYDANHGGHIKFYPDRVHIRLDMHDSDRAYINVYRRDGRGSRIAVLNIRIDDNSMFAYCQNASGTQKVEAHLFRSSGTDLFSRLGNWDQLADPDILENFCMQSYNEFQLLRDK